MSAAAVLLFLIADTGGGHRASASAVARELARGHPGSLEVHIVDPFAELGPAVLGRLSGLYGPITQRAPWLWGGLYHSTNSRSAVAALTATALRAVAPGVRRVVEALAPEAVVSFHPLLNHVTARALRAARRRVPLITVITDLVDVHAAWACRDVDAVVTPSPGGFERCRRAGIPASRCHEIGLPVGEAFRVPPPSPAERQALRRRLGLRSDRFCVLVGGGADGSGGIARRARALASADLDLELAVICGRNRRARRELRGLRTAAGRVATVEGFVTNMADWMRAADVVVTKAGPSTIAEALCCGTPLLLTWYLPGQERGNVEWVVDIGAGRYVPRTAQLIDAVAELAQPGSPSLDALRDAVGAAARPHATAAIADLIAGMALPAAGRGVPQATALRR